MKNLTIVIPAIVTSALMLATATGCANSGGTTTTSTSQPPTYNSNYYANSSSYGTVESVTRVEKRGGDGIGAGAVIGGVVGGVLGHQIGKGKGNTAATVGGALGGAYVGDKIQDSNKPAQVSYQIVVRMDNGGSQTLVQNDSSFQVGERVEVRGGQAYHR